MNHTRSSGVGPKRPSVARHVSTLADVLRWRARRHPDLPASWFQGTTRTFRELDQMSSGLAGSLIGQYGVRPGDRVAILDKNSDRYLELLFAIDKAGAVAVPLNWRLTGGEVATVIADADPALIVAGEEFRANVTGASCPLLGFDDLPRDGNDPGRDTGDAIAWQLYTSGTTGLPKGAMLSNRNLVGLPDPMAAVGAELRQGARALVALPLYHIGGCGWALTALAAGCTAVIVREISAPDLLAVLVTQEINSAFLVPAVLTSLCRTPGIDRADLSALRNVFYGASPISPDLLRLAIDLIGCRFTQLYGLTEATGPIAALRFEDHVGERLLSCGQAMMGAEIRVVDEDGRAVTRGEIGEVEYRGGGIMRGYWRRPDDSAAVMHNGWLRTGDAGSMDEEGFLYIRDRVKDMIISGGENVYPAELEHVLAGHPAIADVAVIGVPDERWGEAVKAVVVRRAGASLAEDELLAWCRGRLGGHKRPRSVDFVETIPRNASGKILKRDLRAPYWAGATRQVH
jgi:acyl-CoA synthetase (AMP-forming)/AMP-acid ligase II